MTTALQLDPPSFQVILAGVILQQGQVILVREGEGPWQIPEIPLLEGEVPEDVLIDGVRSLLGWRIDPVRILDCTVRRNAKGSQALVIAYGCLFDSDWPAVMPDGHELLRCWRHNLPSAQVQDDQVVESWLNEAG